MDLTRFLKPEQPQTQLYNIKNVRKRDGSIEEFDERKLLGWASWACKGKEDLYSRLVKMVLRTEAREYIYTDELQDMLISAADSLIVSEPEYDDVAKQLLLAKMRKQVFQSDRFQPPGLRQWADYLAEAGAWQKITWFTDNEWDQLEKAIDHSRDEDFTYGGLKQFFDKYARRNVELEEIYETPQFMYMGMAMAMGQTDDWSIQQIIDLYDAFSTFKINVPTPPMIGLRSGDNGFASCCLVESGDTLDSLDASEHVVFKMVAARAGIGHKLTTRSVADPVRNGSFYHMGKIPYLRHAFASCASNTQQSRGGSMNTNIAMFDPEVMTILSGKSQRSDAESRLDKIDYTLQVNGFLLERALKKQNITLMSYLYAPEVYEAFYSKDLSTFVKAYEAAERRLATKTRRTRDGHSVPLCPTISAMEVLNHALKIRMEVGRVYLQFVDNTNAHSNFDEPITMTNLCVAPETRILTSTGYQTIKDMQDSEVVLWNGQEWSNTVVRKTGENQKLLNISFSDGSSIRATPYHKFYTPTAGRRADRVKSVKDKLIEVRAKDLTIGMKMPKFDLPVIPGSKELISPWANGFFTGDGTVQQNDSGKQYHKLYFYEDKRALVDKCDAELSAGHHADNMSAYMVKGLESKFFVPSAEYTIQSRIKWLEGLLDADGCLQSNGPTPSVVLSSVNREFLEQVRETLASLGVASKFSTTRSAGPRMLPDGKGGHKEYLTQEVHRITISSTGYWQLYDQGLRLHKHSDTLGRPNRPASQYVTVTSIEDGGVADTFCFTEPLLNLGVFNGILAGNCVEINQPTYWFDHIMDLYNTNEDIKPGEQGEVSLCNLAGITLGKVKTLEEWESVCYLVLKFVDTIIDIQDYAFPQMAITAKKRRNVGIGVMNAAGAMAELGLQYVGEEARNWLHREMEKHAYFLHKASVRLAKERGAADWFKYTLPAKGVLVIDTYKKTVDELVSVGLELDWEELRSDILKYGMRNSVLSAQMPGESSSVVTGSTNSLDPIRALVTVKGSGTSKVKCVAPGATDPSISKHYITAFNVPKEEWVKFNAVAQKFFNQAMSFNEYYRFSDYPDGKIPMAAVLKNVLLAYKYGMKSIYYAWFDDDNGGSVHQQGCSSGGCSI
ncbi:ribonucleotide reductase of class Ia (aerobic) [Proteus phage vB_PMC-PL1]